MHAKQEKQWGITASSIREASKVGMLCDFDVVRGG